MLSLYEEKQSKTKVFINIDFKDNLLINKTFLTMVKIYTPFLFMYSIVWELLNTVLKLVTNLFNQCILYSTIIFEHSISLNTPLNCYTWNEYNITFYTVLQAYQKKKFKSFTIYSSTSICLKKIFLSYTGFPKLDISCLDFGYKGLKQAREWISY